MNNIAKVLIGVGVVTAVAATTYVVVKKSESKQEVPESDIPEVETDAKEEKSIIKRIKKFVFKKVVRFLGWVVLHQQKIEAVGTVLGIFVAVLSVANAIRDYRNGLHLKDTLDGIVAHNLEEEQVWNKYMVWDQTHNQEIMDKLEVINESLSSTPVKKGKSA